MNEDTYNTLFVGVMVIILALYTSITVFLLINNIILLPVSGSSMEPTFDSGCNLTFSQEYTTQTITEGDIITFTYTDLNGDTNYIKHRVTDKIQNSEIEQSDKYTITNNTLKYKYSDETTVTLPLQNNSQLTKNTNQTIYVMKGDNNTLIDPIYVTDTNIKYIHKSFVNTPKQLSQYICS